MMKIVLKGCRFKGFISMRDKCDIIVKSDQKEISKWCGIQSEWKWWIMWWMVENDSYSVRCL